MDWTKQLASHFRITGGVKVNVITDFCALHAGKDKRVAVFELDEHHEGV